MFCKVLRHVLVPSSGLDENNIKGAFYPGAPLAPLYPKVEFYSYIDECFMNEAQCTIESMIYHYFFVEISTLFQHQHHFVTLMQCN